MKNLGIEKSIGIGFEKFWYRKKYRYRFRKILVSKKVSVSVSKKNWYQKKYRIRYRKNLGSEKSFGFGFVQILGFVTHWSTSYMVQAKLATNRIVMVKMMIQKGCRHCSTVTVGFKMLIIIIVVTMLMTMSLRQTRCRRRWPRRGWRKLVWKQAQGGRYHHFDPNATLRWSRWNNLI